MCTIVVGVLIWYRRMMIWWGPNRLGNFPVSVCRRVHFHCLMGNDFPLSNIVAIRKELKKNTGEEHYHLDRTNKPIPYLMPGGVLLHFFIILPFSCRHTGGGRKYSDHGGCQCNSFLFKPLGSFILFLLDEGACSHLLRLIFSYYARGTEV